VLSKKELQNMSKLTKSNSKDVHKIAILTSGGDAPGMNACIRALVLTAEHHNIQVIGYRHGYNGLLQQEWVSLTPAEVQHIIQDGGTILKSARCPEFVQQQSAELAATNLQQLAVDALVIIGGDGSFRGAEHLAKYWPGQILGLPGTIDNDIDGTDATIGYFTAIQTALEAIDKIRDTADAFERIFLVEVMGRHSGFIGLNAAIGSGAEQMLLPELSPQGIELKQVISHIRSAQRVRGRSSYIIVMAEHLWPGGAVALARELSGYDNIDCKPVVLGYLQRGGRPVAQDRLLATKLGATAIEALLAGKTGLMLGEKNHSICFTALADCVNNKKQLDPELLRIQQQIFDPF